MVFSDIPNGFNWGQTGIIVQNNEIDLFAQFVQHHNIRHGYVNFQSILRRIKNNHGQVTFYYHDSRLRYCTPGCGPYLRRVRMSELYEENIDLSDVLTLLA